MTTVLQDLGIDEYENLPDGMNPASIWELAEVALTKSEDETDINLRRLATLSHLQWHTYEIPPQILRENMQRWLLQHWAHTDEFVESVLLIAYSFALDRQIYAKALAEFPDPYGEHARDLDQSPGDNMDPWWSLRVQGR